MKKTALFSEIGTLGFLKRGFTLIELVVVISIIAILSTIALFGFSKAQASGRDASRGGTMTSLRSALERYYADNQKYPSGGFQTMIGTLITGGYITKVPADPSCSTATCAQTGGTWIPCGGATNPQYVYDSSGLVTGVNVYTKGSIAGCSGGNQTCYYLWLKREADGNFQEFASPQ